ncbi:unnamed protein product [Pleuronectes platessa]|uniref:Uncharacterized protein n=1 Tax=Pleuronectes platessa TaxID=8262 RepID=A0A9N7VJ67_PLEPL|nr:unnamed protein product [Pleuronectes platessa]
MVINPHHWLVGNLAEDLLLCSHIGVLQTFCRLILWSQPEKVRSPEALTSTVISGDIFILSFLHPRPSLGHLRLSLQGRRWQLGPWSKADEREKSGAPLRQNSFCIPGLKGLERWLITPSGKLLTLDQTPNRLLNLYLDQ